MIFLHYLLCFGLIIVTPTTRLCRITTTSRRVWMSAACTALMNTPRRAAIASSQRSSSTAAGRLRGNCISFTRPGHRRDIRKTSFNQVWLCVAGQASTNVQFMLISESLNHAALPLFIQNGFIPSILNIILHSILHNTEPFALLYYCDLFVC